MAALLGLAAVQRSSRKPQQRRRCLRGDLPQVIATNRLLSEVHSMRIALACRVCGTALSPGRNWSLGPASSQYCSEDCRSRGVTRRDRDVEEAILELLRDRSTDGSVSPSDVARAVSEDKGWSVEVERVHMAARRLQRAGRIQIAGRARAADSSRQKGAIRLKLREFGATQSVRLALKEVGL